MDNENFINSNLRDISDIISSKTIFGEKIESNGVSIIPVCKIVMGYIGGKGDYFDAKVKFESNPSASACGTGASIQPIGFIVIFQNGDVKFIETSKNLSLEKIVDTVSNFLKESNK